MSARIVSTEGFAVARYFKPFNCAQTLQRFKMHLERFIAKENPSLAIRHETTPGLGSPRVESLRLRVWELSLCLLLLEIRNWPGWTICLTWFGCLCILTPVSADFLAPPQS